MIHDNVFGRSVRSIGFFIILRVLRLEPTIFTLLAFSEIYESACLLIFPVTHLVILITG